jgi:hypothetical protein
MFNKKKLKNIFKKEEKKSEPEPHQNFNPAPEPHKKISTPKKCEIRIES